MAGLDVQKAHQAVLQANFFAQQEEFYPFWADIARREQMIEHQQQTQRQWQTDYAEAQRQLEPIDEVMEHDHCGLFHLHQQEDQLTLDTAKAQEQLLAIQQVLQASGQEQQQWEQQASHQVELQRQLDVTKANLQHSSQSYDRLAEEWQNLLQERDWRVVVEEEGMVLLRHKWLQQSSNSKLFKLKCWPWNRHRLHIDTKSKVIWRS